MERKRNGRSLASRVRRDLYSFLSLVESGILWQTKLELGNESSSGRRYVVCLPKKKPEIPIDR